jgi:hypothetical protein
MNIHIVRGNKDLPMADPPLELTGHHTLPRYIGSREFMSLIYKDGINISVCGCKGEHDYYCDYACKWRPNDIELLRISLTIKPLGEWAIMLIDYLESEPNAYLEYD